MNGLKTRRGIKEIREYDSLSCSENCRGTEMYLPEDVFSELKESIYSYTNASGNDDILQFLKLSYRKGIGEVIAVNNYVGLLQLRSGYQIQILPKIDLGRSDAGNKETKTVFLQMLRSMKDFPNKTFNTADLKIDHMNMYEIFISMFLQDVRLLVRHGLKSSYVEKNDNLRFYKGKLLLDEHIKYNAANGARFFIQYNDYCPDRPENRLIKSTLLKLQEISSNANNQKEIRRLLIAFDMVNISINYEKDFSEIIIDRSTKEYEMLMKWSRVFLSGLSFTFFSGDMQGRSLLFPMEKVFESYVANQLKKCLADSDWDIRTQERGCYLIDLPEKNFALKPDIVIRKADGSVTILDTKWKRLVNKPGANYGISQMDMYQMYAYSRKYNTPDVWLLYPLNDDMRGQNNISFKSINISGKEELNLRLFFVDLADINNSMCELVEKLKLQTQ